MDPYEGLDSNEIKRSIILEIVCFGWENILPFSDLYSEIGSQDHV